MKIGIDKIGFYTPKTYLEMSELANSRNVDYGKFKVGLGQEKMAVPQLNEDAVTLAVNAVNNLISDEDRQQIDLILVGSESGIDNSKSIAVYLQSLCGLSKFVRAVELKQACYGATMGLQLAKGHIMMNPNSKVLVVASDIAKYGLHTPGESTQGAGAIAMVVSKNPKVAVIEDTSTFLTEDIMDFWRPVYSDYAFADGKFSTEKYMAFFETVFNDYCLKTNQTFNDFEAICFHQPFTKLGYKTLKQTLEKQNISEEVAEKLLIHYEYSRTYNKVVGNIYTGSLYLGLISLLENLEQLQGNDRIGMFSYGSGAVGEFFVLQLTTRFKKALRKTYHQALLENRQPLTMTAYEQVLSATLPKDGSTIVFDKTSEDIVLTKIENHIRYYG